MAKMSNFIESSSVLAPLNSASEIFYVVISGGCCAATGQCHLVIHSLQYHHLALLQSATSIFQEFSLPSLTASHTCLWQLSCVCLCLNYLLHQSVEFTEVIVPCCALCVFFSSVYHSSLVSSCNYFHLLVLPSVLLSLEQFQSLRSGWSKLLFDLPFLIYSAVCLGTNPV